jgi:hypothetical protein
MSKARDLANAGTALTTVSATELGYLDGVTSAVQTQIDSKITGSSAIAPTIVDAKGDIIAASASDTVARLAVGSNDTVLTADSSTDTGLKWAAPATPATTKSFSLLNSGGTAMSGSNSVTISGISNMDDIYIFVNGWGLSPNQGAEMFFRINADSTDKYGYTGSEFFYTYTNGNASIPRNLAVTPNSTSYIKTGGNGGNTYTAFSSSIRVSGAATTGTKMIQILSGVSQYNGSLTQLMGQYTGTSTVSSITLYTNSGQNFTQGTIHVYGAN